MIEVKKNETSGEFELVVDGVAASKHEVDLQVHDIVPSKPIFSAEIHDSLLKQKVIAQRFSDLPNNLFVLTLNFDRDCGTSKVVKEIRILPVDMHRAVDVGTLNTDQTISFDFEFDVDNWKQLWSVAEYVEECERIFKQKSPAGLKWGRRGHATASSGFSFYAHNSDKENIIESEISKHTEAVCELLELTEASLMAKLRSESVVMFFDFPEEVKVPCEQYLLYFAQFLRDLEVKADTALTHDAGQVLFTVTPTSEEEALDKIRTALDVYLHLPASPVSNDMGHEIAIQRLESQVLRFQSDLRLAAAELQAKNATIEAQQLTINVQKALLNGEILLDSMKDVAPKGKDEDREEFLGGTLALTVYKDKGVEVNYAKMFRRLRDMFFQKGVK